MIKQAVLLAGGKGTRLRPYTTVLPKPLMPVGDYPILEILIRKLKKAGIEKIIIATGYLSHLLESYFGDGSKWGLEISYSHENEPLGTAGPLKLIDGLDEKFLLMNGDLLTDRSFADLIDFHIKEDSLMSIAVYRKEVKIDLGVLKIEEGNVVDYIEKPTYDFHVSMGIYALNREIIKQIPEGYFDLPDLVLKMIKEKQKISSYFFEGMWLDIGRPNDYEKALGIFEESADSIIG